MSKGLLFSRPIINYWLIFVFIIFSLTTTLWAVQQSSNANTLLKSKLESVKLVLEAIDFKDSGIEQQPKYSWALALLKQNEVAQVVIFEDKSEVKKIIIDEQWTVQVSSHNIDVDGYGIAVYLTTNPNWIYSIENGVFLVLLLSLFVIVAVVGSKWLQLQLAGVDILNQRCDKIIRGEYQQAIEQPKFSQPRIINNAISHLLRIYAEAKVEQGEFYEFIQNSTLIDRETGIGNRQFLENRLQLIQKDTVNQSHSALFILELDDIESPDSGFNSEEAMELLNTIIKVWKQLLSKHDNNLIARYSEHQLAVLLVQISNKDAQKVAEKLLRAASSVPLPRGKNTDNLFHIGGVYFNSTSSADVISECFAALKAAQLQGYNNWFMYDEGQLNHNLEQGSVRWRVLLENAVAKASFVIFGQEVFTVDGRVNHLECYVRLQQEQQLISAAHFIPMAKKCGQMAAIDKIVLEKAAQYLDCNPQAPALAVNLSSETLIANGFEQWLKNFLDNNRRVMHRLWFEFSELSWSLQFEQSETISRMILQAGGRCTMDGCGRQLLTPEGNIVNSISRVKLHRSLIRHIDKNPPQQLYVKSLIEQIKQLKLSVYAEGVEHANELSILKKLGVMGYQGILTSVPKRLG
ncbi:EAL domain-containing protein [Paraferrimonas sp. SM1919]|uniref:EAL domain-containing protein n=1 Tax=Paraferrimonas sp. SM1919 TaxID=2662263 RepID=UPI0013D152B2|nr:EAL domain-containing protein [Paraferrimonas sp. SM1919]